MLNLIFAFLLLTATPFPTPEQVQQCLARQDSSAQALQEELLSGRKRPDIATQVAHEDIRGEIILGFKQALGARGYSYVPVGYVWADGTPAGISRESFIKERLDRELDEAGWYFSKWEFDANGTSSYGWMYSWCVEPKPAQKSAIKLFKRRRHRGMPPHDCNLK